MAADNPPPPTDEEQAESKIIELAARRAAKRAEVLAEAPDQAIALIESAEQKAEQSGERLKNAARFIGTFVRMLRAFFNRTYPDLPWRTAVWGLAALLYFVWPLDLIPDFILVGFVDDIAVIMYVVRQIQKDIDAFLEWESQQEAEPK